jgi:hypothetical protein
MVLKGIVKMEKIRKSKQICTYANDIVVIVRNFTALIDVLLALEFEGRKWERKSSK